jgi:hypothetical protein
MSDHDIIMHLDCRPFECGAIQGGFRQVLWKAKWLVIGLLAPEIVLFTAWYQYVEGRETARIVSKNLWKGRRGCKAASINEEFKAPNGNYQAASNDRRAYSFLKPQ